MNGRPEVRAEDARILRERAAQLARPLAKAGGATKITEILEFRLAEERYALEAHAVHDVQPLRELTPLPGTPDFLAGLVSIRGRLVAVIDLKRFFDLPRQGITDMHSIVLLRSDELEIGLLADTVVGVYALCEDAIQAPPSGGQDPHADYLKGITADRLAVLDAGAILGDRRLLINEDVDL